MTPVDFSINDLYVGQRASFTHTFTPQDVTTFAELSGDYNPLHVDKTYAAETPFGRPIVHGMFAASLFSQLIGMCLPGKHSLYLSQTLAFKKPLFVHDVVEVSGTVDAISVSTKIVSMTVTIIRGNELAITGEAKVQII